MKIIELVKEIGYLFELRDHIGAINIYNPERVKRVHTFSKDLHRKIFLVLIESKFLKRNFLSTFIKTSQMKKCAIFSTAAHRGLTTTYSQLRETSAWLV